MRDVFKRIEKTLSTRRDYWEEARQDLQTVESLDGRLPAFRALPDCPEAVTLAAKGSAAWRVLIDIVKNESADTSIFKNALFLLLYFDSLFVYRELKALYMEAAPEQRPWLDVTCRKIMLRCIEISEETDGALTREIVRNTWRGRLATTSLIVELAKHLFGQWYREIVIRDMAVSDGVTSLDLVEEAARKGVDISITASDLRLHLIYAGCRENEVVCYSNREPFQYEIGGKTYGEVNHAKVPADLEKAKAELEEAANKNEVKTITMLAPQVDYAVQKGQFDISFREEDVFDPEPDIGGADIIRIANLFVERSDEHRGYYYREDILRAMARLGGMVKDGAYLYLDNFIKKVEHVGLWRKDATVGEWTRLSVKADVAMDLEGVSNIRIESAGV